MWTRPFDDERKKQEESYASSSAQAASNHQACLNRMLEALSELETQADPDVIARPEGGEGAPSTIRSQIIPKSLSSEQNWL